MWTYPSAESIPKGPPPCAITIKGGAEDPVRYSKTYGPLFLKSLTSLLGFASYTHPVFCQKQSLAKFSGFLLSERGWDYSTCLYALFRPSTSWRVSVWVSRMGVGSQHQLSPLLSSFIQFIHSIYRPSFLAKIQLKVMFSLKWAIQSQVIKVHREGVRHGGECSGKPSLCTTHGGPQAWIEVQV